MNTMIRILHNIARGLDIEGKVSEKRIFGFKAKVWNH